MLKLYKENKRKIKRMKDETQKDKVKSMNKIIMKALKQLVEIQNCQFNDIVSTKLKDPLPMVQKENNKEKQTDFEFYMK